MQPLRYDMPYSVHVQNLANVVVDPQDISAVGYLERVRAMNALAKVGAAARAEHLSLIHISEPTRPY